MPQQSLKTFVSDLEGAGLLVRIKEELRVDQLPMIMDGNPSKAVFVERVKDCEFSFLANAYSNYDQYALALGCSRQEVGRKVAELSRGRVSPEVIATAPCKQVILTGDDVDLTRLPLFLHHDRDGNAFIQDLCFITADPDTGVQDWGIYRSMYRAKNQLSIDMTCETHRCRITAMKNLRAGKNTPISIVVGGPTLDKLALIAGVPNDTNDWEVLGSFYGAPAKMVKSQTNDLLVPANAEIVLEGEIVSSEGWVHDEGPYGEATGMYGGGLKHNCRVLISCMTFVKNGIYQHATIGGRAPGRTDIAIFAPTLEGDIHAALRNAGIDVLELRCEGVIGEVVYAKIRTHAGGDSKQALAVMLTCSKQGLPKTAMVFDEDIDIWSDAEIQKAWAYRFMPARDTFIIPDCNGLGIDPSTGRDEPPYKTSRLGLDCTIPIGPEWRRDNFDWALAADLGNPAPNVAVMTENDIVGDMESFIAERPRAWKEIMTRYLGQPYPLVYRAFGRLRPRLGRAGDHPWYRYTFSAHDFACEAAPEATTNSDPRHPKA
jgi:2,5-furandicarboxylate decarboxylase 1